MYLINIKNEFDDIKKTRKTLHATEEIESLTTSNKALDSVCDEII